MKNLLVYAENYIYGGLEKYVFDLVKNVNANVVLLFNSGNERFYQFARQNHLQYRTLHIRNNRFLPRFKIRGFIKIVNFLSLIKDYFNFFLNYRYLVQIIKPLKSFKNILIVNGGYPGANSCRSAAIAAKAVGINNIIFSILSNPSISSETQEYPTRPAFFLPRFKSLIKIINKVIDRKVIDQKVIDSVNIFLTNCNATKKNLVLLRKFPETKIKTVYTGIEIPDLNQTTKTTRIQNDFLTLIKNPGETWFGITSFLYTLKGQKFFLYAMKKAMRAGIPNIRGLIVGEGPDYANLKQMAKTLGLEKDIIFTGKYPYPISDIYRFLDVFVFTSLHEGLPYVISEAMAYRLPIISTNVGGIPEQIRDGINGCLVEKANPDTLAKKVIWMLNNREKWKEMGDISYKLVQDKFSIKSMVRQTDNLII